MAEQGNQKEKPDISPCCQRYHLPPSRSRLQALSATQVARLEINPCPFGDTGKRLIRTRFGLSGIY